MKKKKLTVQQQKLKDDFDKMMSAHSRPLERGARAKGQTVTSAPASKRSQPLLESSRKNVEPSLDTGYSRTPQRAHHVYTGDKMVGISMMHKSNLVPVFSAEAAQDVAKMRRG